MASALIVWCNSNKNRKMINTLTLVYSSLYILRTEREQVQITKQSIASLSKQTTDPFC